MENKEWIICSFNHCCLIILCAAEINFTTFAIVGENLNQSQLLYVYLPNKVLLSATSLNVTVCVRELCFINFALVMKDVEFFFNVTNCEKAYTNTPRFVGFKDNF